MSIKITDTEMTSDQTRHAARRLHDGWEVTWLPGRSLTQSQAVTAMVLTEAAGPGGSDRTRPFINGWAVELGLTGPDALARIGEGSRTAGEGR